ncbi:MAG: hypothetical protein ACI4S4_01785, partial [Candidatus Ornithospirochaeta sp.]
MIPFPEYPRPQLERKDGWEILNGEWDLRVLSKDGSAIKEGKILVPYSPEAPMSGFCHITKNGETLEYRHHVSISFPFSPKEEHLILHFGAVDYEAEVYIDGEKRMSHRGGYLPFSLEVFSSSFDILLCVTDPTDEGEGERGKQKMKRGGIWYTPQSGIWQTVWIEKVPKAYIKSIKMTPDLNGFTFVCSTSEEGEGTVEVDGKKHQFSSSVPVRIDISSPHL